MQQTIYRIEHGTRKNFDLPGNQSGISYEGPYRGSFTFYGESLSEIHFSDKNRPGVPQESWKRSNKSVSLWETRETIMNSKSTPYLFGFSNLEDLEFWFSQYLKSLFRKGYRISVYEADSKYVFNGTKQVIFKLGKATLVTRFNNLERAKQWAASH